jgi:hypothetical protein
MDELINLTEYNWAFWVAGTYAIVEFLKWLFKTLSVLHEWFFKKIGIETKKMREKREFQERLQKAEKDIEEIKNTSKHNVNMFLEHEKQVVKQFGVIRNDIVGELNRLHEKIDKQNEDIAELKRENDETDCAMLRDRLNSGMRYFSQNKDEHGNVHISLADYETLENLFQKYFSKKGNGAFKKMYEDEFKEFIIDR